MSYPTMRGKPWSVEEETALLEELASGMTIADIASRHNRTTGGIDGRRAEIAYKMHVNLIPIDQICKQTGLDNVYIREMIRHKDNANAKKNDYFTAFACYRWRQCCHWQHFSH